MTSRTLPKPPSSNTQVEEYMAAVQKGLNSLFVVHTGKGWSVRPAANPKKVTMFTYKAEALRKAKADAKAKQGEVFVFNQDGALIGQEKSN